MPKGKTLWRVPLGIFVLMMLVAGHANQAAKTAKMPSLTAQDYADIEQLYSRYVHGIDSGAENGNLFGNTYIRDAVFIDQNHEVITGRDKLVARYALPKHSLTNPDHFTWNVMIEPAPWGAVGHAYLSIVRLGKAGHPAEMDGLYYDSLVKTPEGWKFQKRHFAQDFPEPESVTQALAKAGQTK